MRYAPRLIPAGSAPPGALVEPLIAAPPPSPRGEHTLIPEVAWMLEQDGEFVHVPAAERAQLEVMRGYAELTKLDGTLANETSLNDQRKWGTFLACAFAAGEPRTIHALVGEVEGKLTPEAIKAAKSAAAIMAVLNGFHRPALDAAAEIALAGIGYAYPAGEAPGRAVLRALDLTLQAKRSVAVVGPNGAGKTTLVADYTRSAGLRTLWMLLDPADEVRCEEALVEVVTVHPDAGLPEADPGQSWSPSACATTSEGSSRGR